MAVAYTIGFLGAGRMATALARGFVRAGLVRPEQIIASDVDAEAREQFAQAIQGRVTAQNREAAQAETIILAVKPAQALDALREIRDVPGKPLLVSIAAGVPLAVLERAASPDARVVRVMPNTPAIVGSSATAYALGTQCGPEDAQRVQELFAAVGVALRVKEPLLDAVTGLSGSGPAFGYLIIEALSDGGVACGLPRETATLLAAQTLLGAARMVLETGQHPGALKDQVTSPGGTTIEGLHQLERGAVRAAMINAVRAAAEKSAKLGQT